jgi:DNA-binding CsgD family transcriptional regulator
MIYAKVDVKLRDHERAHRAGAAMATWTWALLYAREQESDGFVPDVALRGAWTGEKQAKRDAEKLVEVGLWEHADRGYRICRYEAKNDTKESIAARRKETRDRVAAYRKGVTRYNGVTNANVAEGESVLVPGSRSLSGSDQGGAGGRRALRPDEPLTDQRRKDFDALTFLGRPRDIDAEWRTFVDNRIAGSKLFEGEGAIDGDWRNWVRRGNQFAAKEEPKNGGASARARKELT